MFWFTVIVIHLLISIYCMGWIGRYAVTINRLHFQSKPLDLSDYLWIFLYGIIPLVNVAIMYMAVEETKRENKFNDES